MLIIFCLVGNIIISINKQLQGVDPGEGHRGQVIPPFE